MSTKFQIVIDCETDSGAYYFMDAIPRLHEIALEAGLAVRRANDANPMRRVEVKAVNIVSTVTERVVG